MHDQFFQSTRVGNPLHEQRIFLDVTRTVHIRYYKEGEEEKFDRQVYLATEQQEQNQGVGVDVAS